MYVKYGPSNSLGILAQQTAVELHYCRAFFEFGKFFVGEASAGVSCGRRIISGHAAACLAVADDVRLDGVDFDRNGNAGNPFVDLKFTGAACIQDSDLSHEAGGMDDVVT